MRYINVRAMTWELVCSCLAVVVMFNTRGVAGSFLSMLTHSQVTVLDPVGSIDLDCEFFSEDYNMFNNPVVWRKSQEEERTDVNIMGNILPPFLATGRFLVTFSNHYHQHYRLRLSITGLSFEDTGNYTCDVRGTRGNILGSVTHSLVVRAPLKAIYFLAGNSSDRPTPSSSSSDSDEGDQLASSPSPSSQKNLTRVTFVEGVPGRLGCVCLGGAPAPEVRLSKADAPRLRLEEKEETDRGSGGQGQGQGLVTVVSRRATLSGEVGLRTVMYRTVVWMEGLRVTRADEGRYIRCTAIVAGGADEAARAAVAEGVGGSGARSQPFFLETTVKVIVHHRPLIHCLPSSAVLNERNVEMVCEVRASPSLLSLYWEEKTGSDNDTGSLSKPDHRPLDDYSMLVTMRSDEVMETRYLLRRVTLFSFRNYTVVAENAVGRTIGYTELTRKLAPTEPLTILELRQDHRREGSKPRATDHFEYRFASSKASPMATPATTLTTRTTFLLIAINIFTGNVVFAAIDICIAMAENHASKMADSAATKPRPLGGSHRLLDRLLSKFKLKNKDDDRQRHLDVHRTRHSTRTANLLEYSIAEISQRRFKI